MRRWNVLLALAVLALAAGCGPIPSGEAPPAPFPECEDQAFAFAGRSTLAGVGLAEQWPEEANTPADIWITAGPPDPADWGVPPGAEAPGGHVLCVEFDDGGGMVGPIDAWQPPGNAMFDVTQTETPVAIGAVALVLVVAVVAAVSWLAFRREGRSP